MIVGINEAPTESRGKGTTDGSLAGTGDTHDDHDHPRWAMRRLCRSRADIGFGTDRLRLSGCAGDAHHHRDHGITQA